MKNNIRNRGIVIMDEKIKRAASRASLAIAIGSAVAVSGCGVAQSISDTTADAAKWAFTTQVKTMNVDLKGRTSLNADVEGQSLSTVVRFYQLKDVQAFEKLSYSQLQSDDLNLLKADLLATKDVVLRPEASANIAEPMNEAAQFVGVVAFFRDPGRDAAWKVAIPKKQWKKTDPVKIELRNNRLVINDADAPSLRHDAPRQAVPASSVPAAASDRRSGSAVDDWAAR